MFLAEYAALQCFKLSSRCMVCYLCWKPAQCPPCLLCILSAKTDVGNVTDACTHTPTQLYWGAAGSCDSRAWNHQRLQGQTSSSPSATPTSPCKPSGSSTTWYMTRLLAMWLLTIRCARATAGAHMHAGSGRPLARFRHAAMLLPTAGREPCCPAVNHTHACRLHQGWHACTCVYACNATEDNV